MQGTEDVSRRPEKSGEQFWKRPRTVMTEEEEENTKKTKKKKKKKKKGTGMTTAFQDASYEGG